MSFLSRHRDFAMGAAGSETGQRIFAENETLRRRVPSLLYSNAGVYAKPPSEAAIAVAIKKG
jgi:hypothetical protein